MHNQIAGNKDADLFQNGVSKSMPYHNLILFSGFMSRYRGTSSAVVQLPPCLWNFFLLTNKSAFLSVAEYT